MQLVEVLVAALVISFVAAGLITTLAGMYNVNQATQNHILVTTIAQEVVDNARNQSWNSLQALSANGWQPLLTNAITSAATNTAYPRPLLLDKVNKIYTGDSGISDKKSTKLFHGQVRQMVETVSSDVVAINVEVTYPTGRGKNAVFRSRSLISKYGLHN